ncbi:MAG: hypothetical protein ACHQ53_04945 [Polyangiales bacterium]
MSRSALHIRGWVGSLGTWAALSVSIAVIVTAPVKASAQAREAGAHQPSAAARAEPAEYSRLIDAGLSEYDAHDFLEARALFSKAHALYPNARTLRVLGMVEFELRNYPQSIEYLQQALGSHVKPLGEELRAQVQTLLGRAEAFVARLHVEVQPQSAKPQILLDGVLQQVAPSASMVVQVGEHVLEARAEHYRTEKRDLNVKGGEEQSMRITLNRELLQAESATKPLPLYASPWLWAGAGVVAVGATIALALLLQPATKTEVGAPLTTPQTPGGVKLLAHGRL